MLNKNVKNKKILIGISSSIAMYKICSLIRLFLRNKAQVKVVMTENATEFVSPLLFQSLAQPPVPVYVSMFSPLNSDSDGLLHINLAEWANEFILAPATANTISKIANGIADNLLTTVITALPEKKPLIIVPAMNDNMWKNIFIQKNVERLKQRKNCHIVGPVKGKLASGRTGEGRMIEIEEVFKIAKKLL